MSNMKNFLFDYATQHYLDVDGLSENEALRLEVQMLLDFYHCDCDEEISDFFHDIFADEYIENYWMMVSDSEGTYNLECRCVQELIENASILSKHKYNVYFAPNAFNGWRVDNNVVSTQTIFIDIDDIKDVEFSDMSAEELETWLIDFYDIPESLLPNWAVCSGHGLHLYYLTEKMDLRQEENRILRRQYTDYLITYFGADKACRNSSRVLRVPKSFNVKHEERKTYLHHLNTSKNRELKRLDYFALSQDEIEEYMRKNQEAKNAKRRATREHNKKEREGQKEVNSKNASSCKSKVKTVIPVVTEYDQQKLQGMMYYTNFNKEARYWNIIKDLHNYYMRHQGQIPQRRNLFFFVMAVNLKHVMSFEAALEFLEKYIDSDNKEETIKTITHIYERKEPYLLKNITIAELLDFTDEDIRLSYCNFSQARIDQARKETQKQNNQKLAEKRKDERDTEGYRYFLYINVKENRGNHTVKELADFMGVSESTIKRIRRKIREENLGLVRLE